MIRTRGSGASDPAISRQSLKYLKSLLPVAQSASPIFRATAIDTSLMAGLDFDALRKDTYLLKGEMAVR